MDTFFDRCDNYIEKLFRENYMDMVRFAAAALSDNTLAEDVVQETFLTAFHKQAQLMESPSPRGWLFVTLKNKIKNACKAQKRMMEILQPLSELYAKNTEPDISVSVLYRGIIDDSSFQLLTWIYCDRITCHEAAERLDITIPACKKRLQRAREKLLAAYSKSFLE